MDKNFSNMMQAYGELQGELSQTSGISPRKPIPQVPTCEETIAQLGPLPREAMIMGVALSDELPILLNLYDPSPGALMIIGDPGCGKTNLLKSMLKMICLTRAKSEVEVCVISDFYEADNWNEVKGKNLMGVYPSYEDSAVDLIHSISAWAHNKNNSNQSLVFFVDNLVDTIGNMDFETQQSFRWLLLRGPSRRVWPIVTMSTSVYKNSPEEFSKAKTWMESFRTYIFGHTESSGTFRNLSFDTSSLVPGVEFALREGDGMLNFWVPRV